MRYLIVFNLIILFFCSCSRTKKEYYETGELKTEFYKDNNGLKQGEIITYYKDGNIEFKGNYLNDTFNGKYEEYYPNGQLKIQTTLIKGVQDGEFLEYFDNGTLNERSNYINGKENGLFTYYYKNGNVESKINMKDGYTLYYLENK